MTGLAWKAAAHVFEKAYREHAGLEPEAYAYASELIEPMMPAVKEEMYRSKDSDK